MIKHGQSKTRLYWKWLGMRQRCYNKNVQYYPYYGGRGIKVCEDWKKSFEAFRDWALGAGYVDGLSIDRIDFNGNYEPSNCRWVKMEMQKINKRNVLMYNNVSAVEECRRRGIKVSTFRTRLKRGMDIETALNKPVKKIDWTYTEARKAHWNKLAHRSRQK